MALLHSWLSTLNLLLHMNINTVSPWMRHSWYARIQNQLSKDACMSQKNSNFLPNTSRDPLSLTLVSEAKVIFLFYTWCLGTTTATLKWVMSSNCKMSTAWKDGWSTHSLSTVALHVEDRNSPIFAKPCMGGQYRPSIVIIRTFR